MNPPAGAEPAIGSPAGGPDRSPGIAGRLAARLPFYYGWVVLGAASTAMFARTVASAGVLSIFLVPMGADLGWNRATIAGASSVGGLAASALGPAVGWLADRQGPRVLLGGSMIALGLAVASLSLVTTPIAFYAAYVVGRAIFACPVPIATTVAVTQWFRRSRGRALAIANSATFLGLTILPVLVQLSIDAWSWRIAWVILGAIAWLIALAPTWLLTRRRPEDLGLRPDGDAAPIAPAGRTPAEPIEGWPIGAAIRTPTLWLLALAGGCMFAVQAGISVHQAAYFQSRAMSPLIAASIISVMAIANLFGALISGFLCDRIGPRRLYSGAAVLMAADLIFLLLVDTPALAYAYAAALGLTIGAGFTLGPVIMANYYGRRAIGSIRGIAEPFVALGQAAGVLLAGLIFDATGSYTNAILIFAGFAATAAILIAVSGRPRALA